MTLAKPYFRLCRDEFADYALDIRYAEDRSTICRSLWIILRDLEKLFEYIEPSDANLSTYSNRTYELLLRAATDFEANCKKILQANGYNLPPRPTVEDYRKIEAAARLSEYTVCMPSWRPQGKAFAPFADWTPPGKSLGWYQAYNRAKHDRHGNFPDASFANTMLAIEGLVVIVFCQFGIQTFKQYQEAGEYSSGDLTVEGRQVEVIFDEDFIFAICPPKWSEAEKYKFDWDVLSNTKEPYERYPF